MKRAFLIVIWLILFSMIISATLFLSSCEINEAENRIAAKERLSSYTQDLLSIDEKLIIFVDTDTFQDGDFAVQYQIEAPNGSAYNISFEYITQRNINFEVNYFFDYEENWEYDKNVIAQIILKFTQTDVTYDTLLDDLENILDTDHIRLSSKAYLEFCRVEEDDISLEYIDYFERLSN